MGSPSYPTPSQIGELRQAAEIGLPEAMVIQNRLTLTLPPMGLAIVEIH
jgi:hypothetical protein